MENNIIIITAGLLTSEIKQDFFDLRDFKVILHIAYVLLAFSRFLAQMLAKYHSPPQVFVHDFAISLIVLTSLVTSWSNHDGRIMPLNHVQQNLGLHTTISCNNLNLKIGLVAKLVYYFPF